MNLFEYINFATEHIDPVKLSETIIKKEGLKPGSFTKIEGRDIRVLSLKEIKEAYDGRLNFDFKKKHMLPICDIYDNDFIVYDYSNHVFNKVNIVDETIFGDRKSESIKDLLRVKRK